jgi:transposase
MVVVAPLAEVTIHRPARGQVFRDVAPPAAGAQDIHHTVHYLPHINGSLTAAALGSQVVSAARRQWDWPHTVTDIVRRSDQAKGFVVLPKRWIVERTIGWLRRCRRLAKDRENRSCNAPAFRRFASIPLMLRKLCNPSQGLRTNSNGDEVIPPPFGVTVLALPNGVVDRTVYGVTYVTYGGAWYQPIYSVGPSPIRSSRSAAEVDSLRSFAIAWHAG